mmetsp:Transcript_18849/g.39520  ORF Transcript_18849/g.39520 Transcript_18849/m.39520 type:complete len:462 (+) Transcript_18849:396-1781(+)
MNNLGTNGTGIPFHPRPAPHAQTTFRELADRSQSHGHTPSRPLDFPTPHIRRGARVKVLAYHPATGERKLISVIHRAEFSQGGTPPPPASPRHGLASPRTSVLGTPLSPAQMSVLDLDPSSYVAYWPQRRLQDAIYGCVIACTVLTRHVGEASDDAARAAGYEPGHPLAPIVWEITNEHVAIKKVEWRRVQAMRGRLLEDPIKEIAAMQLIGNHHPNVLGSIEVLQDHDNLYSVMPFCRGGDLFGVVLDVSEQRQLNEAEEGAGGMSEPVARYWFRQILFGLHYLQSKGVCHRDLSLENILVDVNQCLVIDMGMCLRVPYHCPGDPGGRAVDVEHGTERRLMVPMGTCGKKNYMSPEIYANRDNFDGFAVDLWAAGVILYIMVTGFPPYDMPTREDERFEIICNGGMMRQLQTWDIHLSEELGNLMQWMLSPNPKDRPTLAHVMSHEWVMNGEVHPPNVQH